MYQAAQAKKLVLVLTTFMSITGAKEAQEVIPNQVFYIHFPVQFQKDKKATI